MAKFTREDVERIVKEAREKGERPDLSGADLSGMNLIMADLRETNLMETNLNRAKLNRANLNRVDLRKANLSRADLSKADLDKANLNKIDLHGAYLSWTLLRGVSLKEADLNGANLIMADLQKADLRRVNLRWAYLSDANLSETNLNEANLKGVNLNGANLNRANLKGTYLSDTNLRRANLSSANLSNAYLSRTNLSNANLSNANLRGAYLSGTNLMSASLENADFNGATVEDTIFVNVDLAGVKGLETVKHESPSIIDINTIHKSGDKIPRIFLEQAGVHPDIIRWQHSLHIRPTVFISYNHKDEAEKDHLLTHLHALQRNDLIDIWHDRRITGGADWKAEIKQAIARASVVILLVSPNFLASDFIFDEEIPAFLERQRSNEKLHLYPIIAKPCNWQAIDWLAKVQVRPKGGQPIWGKESDTDAELAQITTEITEIIKDLMFK